MSFWVRSRPKLFCVLTRFSRFTHDETTNTNDVRLRGGGTVFRFPALICFVMGRLIAFTWLEHDSIYTTFWRLEISNFSIHSAMTLAWTYDFLQPKPTSHYTSATPLWFLHLMKKYKQVTVVDSEGAEGTFAPPKKSPQKKGKCVLISLIFHICWSKIQNFLGSLRTLAIFNNLFKAYITLKFRK